MMRPDRIASLHNIWFTASLGITAAIALAGLVTGFVWLPLQQPDRRSGSVWSAICGAAGLLQVPPAGGAIVQADYPTTRVAVTPEMLGAASSEAIGTGATLALRCSICHGARGLSDAQAPNLAGQYAVAVYKQLVDFQTGARLSAVMGPLVAGLSDGDIRDLAAYYAYLPRLTEDNPKAGEAPRIVASGAPMRGVAPCGSCHGTIGRKPAAAWLGGQPAGYLRAQLEAFASGKRRNDIDGQMRNVARVMTPADIDAASRYYAEHP